MQGIPTRYAVFIALAVWAVVVADAVIPVWSDMWGFFRYAWLNTFD